MHVVLPGDVDDPAAPSGGNTYDRMVCRGLSDAGWTVCELPLAGSWPRPAASELAALAAVLRSVPDGGVVLLDGLVACGAPEVLTSTAERLRLVVLVHLPLADESGLTLAEAAELDAVERRALHAARAVVATSGWAAQQLIARHDLPTDRVHVAAPGVRSAPVAPGTADGSRLVCVAAVTPRKGHDVLIEALAAVAELPWSLVCVGALDRAPEHVQQVRASVERHGLTGRVAFVGPRTGDDRDLSFAGADLLVLASRAETYGMVITEALARGVPVLATAVGGVPEALGLVPGGEPPGLLVPADDPAALAGALRRWLASAASRQRLRSAALARRDLLPGWDATVRDLTTILEDAR